MRRFISREVERVATRKSLVFILRIAETQALCTKCVQYAGRESVSSSFCLFGQFFLHKNRRVLREGFSRSLVGLSNPGHVSRWHCARPHSFLSRNSRKPKPAM